MTPSLERATALMTMVSLLRQPRVEGVSLSGAMVWHSENLYHGYAPAYSLRYRETKTRLLEGQIS